MNLVGISLLLCKMPDQFSVAPRQRKGRTCDMTKTAGRIAEPSMSRQLSPWMFAVSPTLRKARELIVPSMMPKAVHTCHCKRIECQH